MRIIFIGSVEFSYYALEKTIHCKGNVVGVVTKKYSVFNTDFKDLSPLCAENGIDYIYTSNINDTDTVSWIKGKKPDVICCFGWSALIKRELLLLCKLGVIGYHPAELPMNRGRHPLIWALFLGIENTASTFFFMDEGADSGDILSQEAIKIKYEDNARTLYDKVVYAACRQIEEFLPQLENGSFVKRKQNNALSNNWRKRNKTDGQIDFRMSSRAIYYLVRALTTPYIGSHITWNNTDYKVWKVTETTSEFPNIEPGKVLEKNSGRILIQCFNGAIWLEEYEPQLFDEIEVGDYLV